VDDENNKMLPGDKMDHTEIGISTIRHHTRDMSMVGFRMKKSSYDYDKEANMKTETRYFPTNLC
jgi:hypothetical protein